MNNRDAKTFRAMQRKGRYDDFIAPDRFPQDKVNEEYFCVDAVEPHQNNPSFDAEQIAIGSQRPEICLSEVDAMAGDGSHHRIFVAIACTGDTDDPRDSNFAMEFATGLCAILVARSD